MRFCIKWKINLIFSSAAETLLNLTANSAEKPGDSPPQPVILLKINRKLIKEMKLAIKHTKLKEKLIETSENEAFWDKWETLMPQDYDLNCCPTPVHI